MRWIDEWRHQWEHRFDFEKFDRDHRWDRLADYNAEVGRAIVHTIEWDYRMMKEQEAFDLEHHGPLDERGRAK